MIDCLLNILFVKANDENINGPRNPSFVVGSIADQWIPLTKSKL